MANLPNTLYKAARAVRTPAALASGDPQRIKRRARNVILAQVLGALGVWTLWRKLWGGR